MIKKQLWFDRKFSFLHTADMFPNIVERLRGVPARIEEKVSGLSKEDLTKKTNDTWSIQENIGHLLTLEDLWIGRLEDFIVGKETLRPADLTNKASREADYNSKPINEILTAFRQEREDFVGQLDQLSEKQVLTSAFHPRLNQPMRIIDLVFFVAEHDDHHLSTITALMKKLNK
jgi:uncharacterized damage-inducible protein DinB